MFLQTSYNKPAFYEVMLSLQSKDYFYAMLKVRK